MSDKTSLKTQKQILHPKTDLDLAKQIVLSRLAGYSAKVYLFGSQATGHADRVSDIDIAILPLQPISPWVFAEIREALEESPILYPVDVVDLSETDLRFRQRVFKEGILWTE